MDSSAENVATKEIGRIMHGGIDKVEDCRNRSAGCRVGLWEERRVGIGRIAHELMFKIDSRQTSHSNFIALSIMSIVVFTDS